LAEKDVQGLEYFKLLRPFFERLHDAGPQRNRTVNCKVKRPRGHFDRS
jgi:hypothetical protein